MDKLLNNSNAVLISKGDSEEFAKTYNDIYENYVRK